MRLLAVLSVLGALTAAACSGADSDGEGGTPTAPPTAPAPAPETTSTTSRAPAAPTVLALVRADDRLGRVAAALERPELAELAARLADPGQTSTLFAPVDGGLEDVTDAELAALLPAHAVEGTHLAADLAGGARLPALDGTTLVVAVDGGARAGRAAFVTTDVEAANGVVHLVDGPVSRVATGAG